MLTIGLGAMFRSFASITWGSEIYSLPTPFSAKTTRVGDIMTSKVIYVEANQPVEECMAVMIDKNIRHLPVFDGKELLGLISVRDVLKEVVDVQQFLISQLEHYITGGGR